MRRYLTDREKLNLALDQNYRCALCNVSFWTGCEIEYDHSTPVALGNDSKPDQAICKPCHLAKTKQDVKRIAKAKRLHRTFVLGQKPKRKTIQSRGFDRRWRRKMSGECVRRIEA